MLKCENYKLVTLVLIERKSSPFYDFDTPWPRLHLVTLEFTFFTAIVLIHIFLKLPFGDISKYKSFFITDLILLLYKKYIKSSIYFMSVPPWSQQKISTLRLPTSRRPYPEDSTCNVNTPLCWTERCSRNTSHWTLIV